MLPIWLEWIDVVLSVIAFVLVVWTVPTACQMWWGRPSIDVEFRTQSLDPGVGLECLITNKIISNKILKNIRVRRDAAYQLSATAIIREGRTGKFIAQEKLKIESGGDKSLFRIDLHAGIAVWTTVVYRPRGSETAYLAPWKDKEDVEMKVGEYECEVRIEWGQEAITKRRTFRIGDHIDGTRWSRSTNG